MHPIFSLRGLVSPIFRACIWSSRSLISFRLKMCSQGLSSFDKSTALFCKGEPKAPLMARCKMLGLILRFRRVFFSLDSGYVVVRSWGVQSTSKYIAPHMRRQPYFLVDGSRGQLLDSANVCWAQGHESVSLEINLPLIFNNQLDLQSKQPNGFFFWKPSMRARLSQSRLRYPYGS